MGAVTSQRVYQPTREQPYSSPDPASGRRAKAGDLRQELVWWQAPPEPTWPAREQRLDWLEHALSEAYDISRGLAQHGALDGHASLSAYLSIVAARAPTSRSAVPEQVLGG